VNHPCLHARVRSLYWFPVKEEGSSDGCIYMLTVVTVALNSYGLYHASVTQLPECLTVVDTDYRGDCMGVCEIWEMGENTSIASQAYMW